MLDMLQESMPFDSEKASFFFQRTFSAGVHLRWVALYLSNYLQTSASFSRLNIFGVIIFGIIFILFIQDRLQCYQALADVLERLKYITMVSVGPVGCFLHKEGDI